ncbi:hypothetical protein LTR08_005402 [Meristemomyces frigidus]|nr:hypothetical protein LTR08_005402 [Meristemomyces frigidus]
MATIIYTTEKLAPEVVRIPRAHYDMIREETNFDPRIERNFTRVANDIVGRARWQTSMITRRRAWYPTLPLGDGITAIPAEHRALATKAGYVAARDGALLRIGDEDGVALWMTGQDLTVARSILPVTICPTGLSTVEPKEGPLSRPQPATTTSQRNRPPKRKHMALNQQQVPTSAQAGDERDARQIVKPSTKAQSSSIANTTPQRRNPDKTAFARDSLTVVAGGHDRRVGNNNKTDVYDDDDLESLVSLEMMDREDEEKPLERRKSRPTKARAPVLSWLGGDSPANASGSRAPRSLRDVGSLVRIVGPAGRVRKWRAKTAEELDAEMAAYFSSSGAKGSQA